MRGAAVEALAVVAADDCAFVAFTDGEVDRSCRPRHQRDHRRLVALAEDAQGAVPSLEAEIFDVGAARLRDAQAVEPEKHRERGVRVIEAFGGEQEGAKFATVHAVPLAWLHLRSADVLGGVRRDAPVDVREAVVAAHRRQSPVDRRCRQAAVLHPPAVQLDVWSGRGQYDQADIGRPLEESTKVVAIGVKGSAAVASKERSRSQLSLIARPVRPPAFEETSVASRSCSWWNLLIVGRSQGTPRRRAGGRG